MARMRDFQRSKLYAWETATIPNLKATRESALSLDVCSALIKQALNEFGMARMPRVADGRGRRRGGGSATLVTLPMIARTAPYVLHETAHCIAHRKDPRSSWHGSLFVAIYIRLLSRLHPLAPAGTAAEVIEETYRASARAAGLLVRDAL